MTYDAMTGTVDFSEALQCMRRGGKLWRKGWRHQYPDIPLVYVRLDLDGPEPVFEARRQSDDVAGGVWLPSTTDLLAADWEELP